MSSGERKDAAVDRPRDLDSPASQGTAAPAKKAYRKPVLSKYERVHGIGIGSPD